MSFLFYILAALAEIAGCFAFWAWWKLDKSVWWLAPGMAALAAFGWLLAQVDTSHAGRAFAAYGGIYIIAAILWGWTVEGQMPDRWDMAGGALCLIGALVIFAGPRDAIIGS